MKIRLILFLILTSVVSFGQSFTTVTATLTDANSQAWANATVVVKLLPNATIPGPVLNQGHTITDSLQTISANGSGVISVVLDDNLTISPPGSKWQFTICSNTSAPCSIVNATVTGASQSLSTTLSNGLILPVVNGSPVLARAYSDAEVSTGIGAQYYNTINNVIRVWNGSWSNVGSGGTPGGSNGQIQYNSGGSFGGFTLSGDCSLVPSTGVITCTKTGGVAFAASATTDTTIATNIISGSLPCAQLPALTGDLTSSGCAGTFATVNGNVGSFTNANITVNAKGLITAAANGSAGSVAWSAITNPAGNLALTMSTNTSNFNYGSALAGAFGWNNTTSATNVASQNSPHIFLSGQYWTGAATGTDTWDIQSTIANGTNGAVNLVFTHTGSSGALATIFPGALITNAGTNLCGTSSPCIGGVEGSTAPTPAATNDFLHFNSTNHCAEASYNGSTLECIPTLNGSFTPGHAIVVNAQLGSGAGYDLKDAGFAPGGGAFPITITGGVSGGIPCFTSTTVEAASAILNANIIVKGGGAGVCPTNSSITDNATLISTVEGISVAPTSTSQVAGIFNNPTSTSVDIAQFQVNGTTQARIFDNGELFVGPSAPNPTLGTGSGDLFGCGTAPTGIAANAAFYCNASNFMDILTATTDLGPAVAESAIIGANIIAKGIGTNPGIAASSITDNGTTISSTENISVGTAGGIPNIDKTIGFLATAMGAQSTATCTNITNMTWNIAANKNYVLRCEIPVTLAATATIQYCLGGPGTATSYSLMDEGALGAASVWAQFSTLAQTAYGTKTGASSAVATNTVHHVWASIQNGATASGTALTLQTAANGTNNITVGANAVCTLTQVN